MTWWTSKVLGVTLTWTLSLLVLPSQAETQGEKGQKQKVSEAVQTLNSFSTLREGLAATLEGQEEVTIEDFRRVCAPIGQQLQAWAQEKGYEAKQVATKYRNPANRASEAEAKILKKFAQDSKLDQHQKVRRPSGPDDPEGIHLYVPIRVASSCLHCHGAQASRPEFVRQNYPEDKAYNFKAGDLRGMYSVFIKN